LAALPWLQPALRRAGVCIGDRPNAHHRNFALQHLRNAVELAALQREG
jgi:hypothetical protein